MTAPPAPDFDRGLALHRQGRMAEAARIYCEVLLRRPDHADALHCLGIIALQTRRLDEAVDLIGKAIALKPIPGSILQPGKSAVGYEAPRGSAGELRQGDRPEAGFCGSVQQPRQCAVGYGASPEALASYDKAIALKPDFAEAYNNRGIALRNMNRPEEALASCDRAIALKPDYAEAYSNRGNALRVLKRPEEALANYELQTRSCGNRSYPEAYRNQSHCLLEMGRFEPGWRLYEWRKKLDQRIGLLVRLSPA